MAAALDRLRWHGVETETLDRATQLDVDRFVIRAITRSEEAFQGHHETRIAVTMEPAALSVDPGSVLSPRTSGSRGSRSTSSSPTATTAS